MPNNTSEPGPAWPLLKTAFFFVLVPGTVAGYLPYAMLQRRGLWVMPEIGAAQGPGALLILLGAAGLLWCGWHFAVTGRGTPAPFDPPRRLVAKGPYLYVRNPMYVTVATALIGESLFFESWLLVRYLAVFWLIIHLFVLLYEEPTLHGKFGESYGEYLRAVPRWIPRFPGYKPHG
jgi:protein-S-isoprenylcysteine O-methyltransferase Ste14